MGNFNTILTCANTALAPLANPSFTGNVGIGTTTPTQQLQVTENVLLPSANANTVGNLFFGGDTSLGVNGMRLFANGNGYLDLKTSSASNGILFRLDTGAGGTERMRINAAGDVGIGTPSPAYTLQVNGSAAGSQAWIVVSDARLKMNVKPISDALSAVERLRGVRFQWRPADDRPVGRELRLPQGGTQIGFVAQEVEAVIPEVVVAPKKGSDSLYGVKEADLVPILVEAVKQQQKEIDQLRAKLATLTAIKDVPQ